MKAAGLLHSACRSLATVPWLLLGSAAIAGPPFLTDDPEPTDAGHWEIYAPALEIEGRGAEHGGSVGVELNYGLAQDLQLTLGLPLAFTHDATGGASGPGDVEASLKYRFLDDAASHLQVAFFPGVGLPTARSGLGAGRVTALLPIWAQRDVGPWSIFGGGGYAINPGPGKRNYWTGGLALSRQITEGLLLGVEADRQGAETRAGNGATRLGIGAIYKVHGPLRLLASAGPIFEGGVGAAGYHAFAALGWDF